MKFRLQLYVHKLMHKVHINTVQSLQAIKLTKNGKKTYKAMKGGYKGSAKEFRNNVVKYWKPYGIRPKRFWYNIYGQSEGAYNPRYIPDSIWYKYIIPHFNHILLRTAYSGKATYDRVFPGVKKPEMVVKNICGVFYTEDNVLISKEEAIALCKKEENLIFKPAIDSGEGRSVNFFEKDKMPEDTVDKYFEQFVSNFVVQRLVKQHPDLARINPTSLNTVRAISFFFNDKVYILSAQLRMGVNGSRVDNFAAGGTACSIKPDGWLEEKALTRQYTWEDAHPNGLKFKEIKVPSYDRIIETIKKMHTQMPFFRLIGWDFAVDDQGDPVFIELNIKMAQNQIGSGRPAFGDLTEEVLEEVFIKKELLKHKSMI